MRWYQSLMSSPNRNKREGVNCYFFCHGDLLCFLTLHDAPRIPVNPDPGAVLDVHAAKTLRLCNVHKCFYSRPVFCLITTQLWFKIVQNIAEPAQLDHALLSDLLRLPNEVLLDIAHILSISNVRHLSKVSCRLYFFVRGYLVRYRYNVELVTTSQSWSMSHYSRDQSATEANPVGRK
jgi:hypothetical protein